MYNQKMEQMITTQLMARGIRDERVLNAMRKVPRHEFVAAGKEEYAYADAALPVGHGQTISQPFMVALMTQALQLQGNEKVLEIGTGTGYQTAILAELAKTVYTVEKVSQLSEEAQVRLEHFGYDNVHYRIGDGTKGWPDNAPYDAMIVTAGGPLVPPSLYDQLAMGGRMVIPTGERKFQDLLLVSKTEDGKEVISLGKCGFVPLLGEEGWED
ncbi:protein-L-isoaspartate(D-aspartate) O-methyltransferase [Dethiobacter alkaliphilus]|uniref:protein-L-isoaspartate(D-aspartate) O-methyltransferase n=1 Tax=Dethiobacter alkaliphilus TaxID=427926 RepID=UPI0022269628|nr:protein-L-isoaspartate(D-aspartate) O-methyltransferase [Dethiobacter alkaliphilus]MCW3489700.1 protein-L-isoaspartate(D-aspartate) O-methyltransferase [Dethiobacter alkaliphilus]